jgi:hypothetical protein
MTPPTIKCIVCKDYLPLLSFYKDASRRYGYGNRCKDCTSERERRRYVGKKELVRSLKDRPCMDCGVKYPHYVMDFDHQDRSEKRFDLSDCGRWSPEAIKAEAAKCDVVCANCHRERTQRYYD